MITAKIFYGNGECSIDGYGSNIRGVQIIYEGNIGAEKTASDDFVLMDTDGMVIIFPVSGGGYLNDLFNYVGEFTIISVIVADEHGKQVRCTIHGSMNYSELIESNAEDLTTKSEDLSISNKSTTKKHIKKEKTIKNLNTADNYGVSLYLKNGEQYSGYYHVHLKDSSAMTGAVHDNSSQDLYIKKAKNGKIVDKLVPTRKPKKRSFSPKRSTGRGRPLQSGEKFIVRKRSRNPRKKSRPNILTKIKNIMKGKI